LLDEGVPVTDKKGKIKPNTELRDFERIPLGIVIEEYFEREVKPHLPNAYMDRNRDVVGYEINFTKHFYKYKPLRSLDLLELEKESEGLMKEILK
jgi:type I restriction enzyme M protein